jgi:hypothetical protein
MGLSKEDGDYRSKLVNTLVQQPEAFTGGRSRRGVSAVLGIDRRTITRAERELSLFLMCMIV